MSVNIRKLRQLIIFFASHEMVKPLGRTKLFKLLYFTDVTHLQTIGELLTGAEYLKYPYGPFSLQGDFALKELKKHGLIKQERVQITDKDSMLALTTLQIPDMTIFTESEMVTIDYVIEQYGKDTASALSWKSHQEDAWLFAKEWMPLQLCLDKPNTESKNKNAAAIAWVEQWYATPDDQPPHYWDELEELLKTSPITFGDEDLDL
jgi:uncharacterized phage-associated protein